MRRITLNRPNRKLRGVRRHLRSLTKWADLIHFENDLRPGEKYVNFKVPLPAALVEGPRSRHRLQADVISQLLRAAEKLARQQPPENSQFYRVAVLLTLPNLFASEVTLFFDEDYFHGFLYENSLPDSQRPSQLYDVKIPEIFDIECGCLVSYSDDEYVYRSHHWTITASTPHQI